MLCCAASEEMVLLKDTEGRVALKKYRRQPGRGGGADRRGDRGTHADLTRPSARPRRCRGALRWEGASSSFSSDSSLRSVSSLLCGHRGMVGVRVGEHGGEAG